MMAGAVMRRLFSHGHEVKPSRNQIYPLSTNRVPGCPGKVESKPK